MSGVGPSRIWRNQQVTWQTFLATLATYLPAIVLPVAYLFATKNIRVLARHESVSGPLFMVIVVGCVLWAGYRTLIANNVQTLADVGWDAVGATAFALIAAWAFASVAVDIVSEKYGK